MEGHGREGVIFSLCWCCFEKNREQLLSIRSIPLTIMLQNSSGLNKKTVLVNRVTVKYLFRPTRMTKFGFKLD